MELSIDTSTRFASVGLSNEGECLAELVWRSERNHSVELVPSIKDVMARADVEMDGLDAIFVAIGPGGFSALRVGVSTAKAMALALNISLVSVGTLDIEARPYLGLGVPVCAAVEAGRQLLYIGRYADGGAASGASLEVVSYEGLTETAEGPTLFCGEGIAAVAEALGQRLGPKALVANAAPPTRRPGVLASLGNERWRSGESDDPATLQPLYLRSVQIDVARKTWAEPRR